MERQQILNMYVQLLNTRQSIDVCLLCVFDQMSDNSVISQRVRHDGLTCGIGSLNRVCMKWPGSHGIYSTCFVQLNKILLHL